MRIACFVSPHGLGHAARAAAVLAALRARVPELAIELFTLVPETFFADSQIGPFSYHALRADVGMVQTNPLDEDVPATVAALQRFIPFDPERVRELAATLRARDCVGVLCDIAPLGLAVARAAGIPSVLMENFTWDWIYAGYVGQDPRLEPIMDQMRAAFALADYHIQTTPVCRPDPGAFQAGVVSRAPRTARADLRRRLGIPPAARVVLLSGRLLDTHTAERARLHAHADITFLLAGGAASERRDGNVIELPADSTYYHPDLVNACDLMVGKLGYSTIAETYYAGVPFLYVVRRQFPESRVLEAFVVAQIPSRSVAREDLASGAWVDALPALLKAPRRDRRGEGNGADAAANWLLTQAWRR